MRLGNAADITGQGACASSPQPVLLYACWQEPGAFVVLHPERWDTGLSVLWAVFALARAGNRNIVVALPGLSPAFRQPRRRFAPLSWAWFLLNAALIPALACARASISFVILQQPRLSGMARRRGYEVFPSFVLLARAYAAAPVGQAPHLRSGKPWGEREVRHLPL
jgi:hypothetical protein